jgi:hypothetical protein
VRHFLAADHRRAVAAEPAAEPAVVSAVGIVLLDIDLVEEYLACRHWPSCEQGKPVHALEPGSGCSAHNVTLADWKAEAVQAMAVRDHSLARHCLPR